MNTSLSRRYAEKTCRQLNVGCLRGMSAVTISSNSERHRIWSGSLSFASPEADFVSFSKKTHLSTQSKNSGPAWSSMLSFASPDSDFVSASKTEHLREYTTDNKEATWSESLSVASPESDFVSAPTTVHNSTSTSNEWSGLLSFASPESDFMSAPEEVHNSTSTSTSEWSGSLSFASPESDFKSAPKEVHNSTSTSNEWSDSLSFASPDSDFMSADKTVHNSLTSVNDQWSQSLSFVSPESDFVSAPQTVHLSSITDKSAYFDADIQEFFESQRLYTSPETATGFMSFADMIDEDVLETLRKKYSLKENMPKTVEDALNDERPIVITTAESPFRVVDVNGAWEGLCGYSRDEAIGCNIGSLLQGPETNVESANEMVRSLQENGYSDTILTNYAKNGRSFENHIQIGMIPRDTSTSNDLYFVGVLDDISGSNNERVATM